ncbi:uroporphyrinogen-III synthase [Zavarzinia compransoris]|uniref:Uroporphyrinogen-III synthase n=1 Tax=Zavarzinia compransoris TaxID=1264899 RepID=A0A317DY59_9PROT|nr:uroporphyrinogen-III synthase [Zavarzinia compransoris]PWR18870.1 hypothetical protein DKG75_18020 [Zavarzinia compransoris]TDP48865.1 uroporphyrinogen-III synthase [Zavarzinia compransoris]
MRLLITRIEEEARRLAWALERHGHDSVLAPLLEIRFRADAAIDTVGAQALLVTSGNGIAGLARAVERRDIPLYAVGDSTARRAREAGFETVVSAEGDVVALTALVARALEPAAGRLIHAGGATVAGDLAGDLRARGFTVERVALYDAVPVDRLPPDAVEGLHAGAFDGILFFSPRTAATFVTLASVLSPKIDFGGMTAYCLSAAVASALAPLGFGRVRVAAEPTEAALVALIGEAGAEAPAQATEHEMTERPDQPGSAPDQRDDLDQRDGTGPVAAPEPPAAETEIPVLDKPLEDPPPRLDSPAYAVPPPARGSRRSLWYGVAAIALIGAGAFVWHRYGDRIATTLAPAPAATAPVAAAGDARLGALEAAVAGLDRKIQALEARVAELPATADKDALEELRGEIAALRERQGVLEESLGAAEDAAAEEEATPAAPAPAPAPGLMADAALSARLAAIEAKLAAPAADAGQIAALEREIAALKAAAGANDARIAAETEKLRAVGRGVALVYGIGRLRGALAAEAPYAAALATVHSHFEALKLLAEPAIGKALETLAARADKGLPTRAALATAFSPLARAAVQAANIPADADVVDRLLAEAGNLVTIRPVGEVAGEDAAAVIARAEVRLARNDLAGAVAEIARLQGGAAAALAPWRAEAEARLAAEAAVDLLDGEVSARFAEAN